jgi:histidinol-phosphate/aromatic aminotransferase/cobyric acid decarboxylase-like protein
VSETHAERERLASCLRELGLQPLESYANFVYVPMPNAEQTYDRLLRLGLVVRPFDDAIRITVHAPQANDRLLDALEQANG